MTAARLILATGFVADTPETASEFPSAGKDSSDPAFQAVYWRCIAVMLFSARLYHPDAELILFSNVAPPRTDGVDLVALFDRLEVTRVLLPLTHRLPPVPGKRRWGSVFYVLDIIDWLATHRRSGCFALFDSDVVVTAPLDGLQDAMREQAFGGLRMAYPADYVVNGLTPAQAADIAKEFGGADVPPSLTILGGEILLADVARLSEYRPAIERLWSQTIEMQPRAAAIRTEEHFWPVFHAMHGIVPGVADPFIKRLATYRGFDTVRPGDETIPAWHLPAEKHAGFRGMFRLLTRRRFDLAIEPDAFRREAMRQFGVPRGDRVARLKIAVRRATGVLRARYVDPLRSQGSAEC